MRLIICLSFLFTLSSSIFAADDTEKAPLSVKIAATEPEGQAQLETFFLNKLTLRRLYFQTTFSTFQKLRH